MCEDVIGSMLAALKAFTHKFVYKHLGMTTSDLLVHVQRYDPTPKVKVGLSPEQLATILGCYADNVYEDVRDQAMIAFYAASGLRFEEVLKLTVSMVDPYSGWVKTIGK